MNYKVLYRKYRPSTFDSVVGQNNSIRLLKDSILNDKISHAYIFSGPRGTGKTSTAKIFAKAINCTYNKDGNPCLECESCKNFDSSSDIYEIDAASNNGVDQIREIIDNIKLAPIASKYKVYIIDEVHMLSDSAFNALLLTLEEPPSHVVFILATTDIQKVPITVLSRCQRIDFKKLSVSDICDQLKNVSTEEKIKIDDDSIKEIAEFADGGMRDALSILDQLSKSFDKITINDVLDSIGLVSNKQINDLIDAINDGNVQYITNFIDEINNKALDYKTIVRKLINEIKNRCINIKLGDSKDKLSYSDYLTLVNELSDSIVRANVNVNSYDILEIILLNSTNNSTVTSVTKTVEAPKKETKELKEPMKVEVETEAVEPTNFSEFASIRINNCFVDANKESLSKMKEIWKEYLEKNKSKTTKGILMDSSVVCSSETYVVIKTDYEDNANLINENYDIIEQDLKKYCKINIKVVGVSADKWVEETNKFKENKKNKIKYEYKDEVLPSSENDIVDIFASNKVEIK